MKLKSISLIIILTLFLIPISTQSDKILDDEIWEYTDDNGVTHNETAIDTILYDNHTKIANHFPVLDVVVVETTRDYAFTTYYSSESITVDLSIANEGNLYLTQEGGYPLFGDHEITGTIDINGTVYNATDNHTFMYNENIQNTFADAVAIRYLEIIYWEFAGGSFEIVKTQEINTDQTSTDSIRNYTLNTIDVSWSGILTDGFQQEEVNVGTSGLQLLQENENMKFTWDSSSKLPTYIKQQEETTEGLSLDQNTDFVEYFLVQDEDKDQQDEQSITIDAPFLTISTALIAIPVILFNRFKS